jgi:hypothetical protein
MATLRRDDGVQFIIRPYREIFSPDRTSILKRRITNLAHKQGENVRVSKLDDGRLGVACSREPGFLLGETVWIYLNKPANLIYCEALADERRQALLVVIKNGVVFLDAKVSFTNLIDEFISLSINNDKYDIYVYGDVPLAETEEGGRYAFDAKNVTSFNKLDEPLLPKLPIYEETQLQPLGLALTSPYLGKSKLWPIILGSILVIVIVMAWHIYKAVPEVPTIKLPRAVPMIAPYEQYYKALETPAPQDQIAGMIIVTQMAHNFPGWKLNNISYDGTNYILQFTINGGSIVQAQAWAKQNNVDLELQENGVTLTIPSNLKNRSQFKVIYPLEQVIGLLVDNINRILAGKNVTFSDITTHDHYKEATVTINFSNTYPGMLTLVGEALDKLPVAITAINLKPGKNLFSGTITLKVLGD